MNPLSHPLLFTPRFRDYIWGGRRLETIFHRALPPGIVAESWEISGHHSMPTTVENGPLAGEPLTTLTTRFGTELCGTRAQAMIERGKFPLLIKLLDAAQPLSVQVHPDDAYAAAHENGEMGKTEMWYILHADPGARLMYGLRAGCTREEFHSALLAGTLDTCLHSLQVRAGDTVFIPAGSIHAIMDGIVLAEIQQNSDTTYRVYDWNRVGADGLPRPLHIDKAMDVIDFTQCEPGVRIPQRMAGSDQREMLVSCPQFAVERVTLGPGTAFEGVCSGETFEIWGCVEGAASLATSSASVDLPSIRFALLAAQSGAYRVTAHEHAVMLRTYLPGT